MAFHGAVIREQGVTFAIVIVKKYVVDNKSKANEAIQSFLPVFTGIPVIIMAQNHRGVPIYYGRKDIVQFMSKVPIQSVPWEKYSI